jgi:UDP-N-acetylmuramoylalanine--D-glutamate ligase
VKLVPRETTVVGQHLRTNLLFAAVAAYLVGMDEEVVRRRSREFSGIPHRLELIDTVDGIRYYNDSAATIPEATAAAVAGLDGRIHLIAGGSDKKLSLDAFLTIAREVTSLHLLAGSATERIVSLLGAARAPFTGPHDSLEAACAAAAAVARNGDAVLLSPGCASFGMFRNEFDRGNQFRALVNSLRQ